MDLFGLREHLALQSDRQIDFHETRFEAGKTADGRLKLLLETYNLVTPLEDAGEPVTREPDATRVPA